MRTAVVFVGGPLAPTSTHGAHPGLAGLSADRVVAADSGLHLADAHGWDVDLVVGDMDSVDPERLRRAAADGVVVDRRPVDKDATDLELALDVLLADDVRHTVVIATDGGRTDHLFAVVLGCCSERFAPLGLRLWLDSTLVVPVRGLVRVEGRPGAVLSILAVHGPAVVTTQGLRWPLHSERLDAGSTRGVSNELVGTAASIEVTDGCDAVLMPEEGLQ